MNVTLKPITGLPMVAAGDDLGTLVADAMDRQGIRPLIGDVLVVCQKVVSKAEGRIVDLTDIRPGRRARTFAELYDKNPAVVQAALSEATEVLRMENGHLITATGPGWICANSGLDRSNQNKEGEATLLPLDADESAAALRASLSKRYDADIAVVISDTFGRPWRLGQVDVAIGAAVFDVLDDHGGRPDLGGRPLEHTLIAVADQLAAAAGLLAGKADGIPVVLVSGLVRLSRSGVSGRATNLIRPREEDLFR